MCWFSGHGRLLITLVDRESNAPAVAGAYWLLLLLLLRSWWHTLSHSQSEESQVRVVTTHDIHDVPLTAESCTIERSIVSARLCWFRMPVMCALAFPLQNIVRRSRDLSRSIDITALVVVVVEFFNKTLSNAKQTMKMQADNTHTKWALM